MQYKVLFEEYSSHSIAVILDNSGHELGYRFLNNLLGRITDQYQVLLVVTSVLSVVPLWYFYRCEVEKPILTIVLFLSVAPFVMYFSGIRQAIAMGFAVPCWYAAKQKKKWRFVLLVLVAIQFHTSAFMLFVIYPLFYARITKKWLFVVVPIMLAVYSFKEIIFGVLFQLLWKEFEEADPTGAITTLILLILYGIYSYVIPDEKQMDSDTTAMRNLLLLSIMIQFFAMLHPLSMRMNYYFLIFVPLLLPKLANRSRKDLKMVADVSVGVLIVYFTYYFIKTIVQDDDPLNIIPYIPFWKN